MEDDPPDRRGKVYVMDTRPYISLVLEWRSVNVALLNVSLMNRISRVLGNLRTFLQTLLTPTYEEVSLE